MSNQTARLQSDPFQVGRGRGHSSRESKRPPGKASASQNPILDHTALEYDSSLRVIQNQMLLRERVARI